MLAGALSLMALSRLGYGSGDCDRIGHSPGLLSMHIARFIGKLVIAVSVVTLMYASGVALAQTSTEDVPSAPTDVQFLGGALRWTDNADNEDGYRITIRLRATVPVGSKGRADLEFRYEVGPDVTSFPVPEEAHITCPDRTSVEYTVVGFNEAGVSKPGRTAISVLCPAAPTATAATPVGPSLPTTGTGASTGSGSAWLIAALALAGLALASGGAFALKRR